ncbi:MAG: hypothetical protein ACXW31_13405 [Thermoanaerobaculia bacterium]
MFDVTSEERDYLVDVLKHAHRELLHELHHADHREFRQMLRKLIHLNEAVTRRIHDHSAGVQPAA